MGILLFIALIVIPAWYINRFLLWFIAPRRSFGRFILYIVSGFALAFLYTFIFVWIMLKYL
jgi:hypothetical protein